MILVIFIGIIGSLSRPSSNLPYLLSVLEDQQDIAHISNEASLYSNISSNYLPYLATSGLILNSNSNQLESYLTSNNLKYTSADLTLKESPKIDGMLSSAEASGNYNTVLDQVAHQQLNGYLTDLKVAFNKVSGSHGKVLLSNFYSQAKLLLISLNNGT